MTDRLSFGFHNQNHAAALACALLSLCLICRRTAWRTFAIAFALLMATPMSAVAAEAVVDCVEVATRAPNNQLVKVWYRVPRGYDAARRERYRVLVLFGGRNCDGRPEVSGKLGWTAWADLNGVFLVAPTMKDDDYWEPASWSGRALLSALDAIAAKFRVATRGLLFYGYSAGSQASNLFPAWRPDLCRAYVSHACGVFHRPTPKMRGVPGLVTCGDADSARHVLSRRFVGGCRDLGVPIVWKSFPNHPHDVPEESLRLAREFLSHHHWSHPEDLGGAPLASTAPTFVGDDASGTYHPPDSPEAAEIPHEDRVSLPSELVASAWGAAKRGDDGNRDILSETSSQVIDGVEVVFAVPKDVRPDSRILVLLGGRGWPGRKSMSDLGFVGWAASRRWCVVAPSFTRGEYWMPANGSAEVLRKAVDSLCQRHFVRQYPVFVFGYSAGGQLAALLQERPPFPVAAWAVHGCGVFPDPPPDAGAPAFVSCGVGDDGRFAISRTFACRYREAGGLLLWKPTRGGHELDADALVLAQEFFAAVAAGMPCSLWGEDDTLRTALRERIDIEYLNPLYNRRIADLWRME